MRSKSECYPSSSTKSRLTIQTCPLRTIQSHQLDNVSSSGQDPSSDIDILQPILIQALCDAEIDAIKKMKNVAVNLIQQVEIIQALANAIHNAHKEHKIKIFAARIST